jgi:hypothetical protein
MPTFDLLSTVTTSASASVITLSSIPQTYTDLELHCFLMASASSTYAVTVNGSTASTYRIIRTGSVGTSAFSSGAANWTIASSSSTGNSILRLTLDNYSNTAAEKSGTYQYNREATTIEYGAIMRVNTEAISSISITISAGNFVDGSTAHLYGIASS